MKLLSPNDVSFWRYVVCFLAKRFDSFRLMTV